MASKASDKRTIALTWNIAVYTKHMHPNVNRQAPEWLRQSTLAQTARVEEAPQTTEAVMLEEATFSALRPRPRVVLHNHSGEGYAEREVVCEEGARIAAAAELGRLV